MLRARRSVRSSTATRSTFVIGSSMRGLRMIIRIIHHIKSECALRYAFYDLSGMTSALNFTRMAVPRARGHGSEELRRLVERAHSAHLKVLRRQPRRQFAGWKDSHPSARYIRP